MLWWLINCWEERHEWEMVIVFANTGLEASETLVFVHKCATEWGVEIIWVEARHRDDNGVPFSEKGWSVSHQVVNYFSAARCQKRVDGTWAWTPFEEMISVLGIPSTNAPFCSDQLKKKAINSYLRSIGFTKFHKAIGIRVDEIDRMNENANRLRIIYPLIKNNPTNKAQVLGWWEMQTFNLEAHDDDGNCKRCWKKDMLRLARGARRELHSFEWWQYVTDKYGYLNPRNTSLKPPFNFYRGNLSPRDIQRLSLLPDNEISTMASREKLDGCSESCEAF